MIFSIKRVILLVILSCFSFAFSVFFEGSLRSPTRLSGELKSPPDSLYQWNIGNEAPFSYRVLHRSVVMSAYRMIRPSEENNQLFFYTYSFFAFLFQSVSIFLFYVLLIKLGLQKESLTGATIFALLPAFLLAYNSPVHTREDMMGYTLLLLGLMLIIDNSVILLLIVCLLGVLCRETLLIIPFVNLFFNHRQKMINRMLIAVGSFGLFILIRYVKGGGGYDYMEGFRWNRQHLVQVVSFAFIAFGVLWLPLILSFFKSNKTNQSDSVRLIYRSAPAVFCLILVTTFFGGIFNEIRLLYLLAPWVITIGLMYFKEQSDLLRWLFSIKYYKWAVLLSLFVMIIATAYLLIHISEFISPSKYSIPYEPWIIVSLIQLFLTAVLLPVFFLKKKEQKLKV